MALVLIYGLPALNAAIPWHNEIQAGDVLDLGRGTTAVPPPGWQLEDGTQQERAWTRDLLTPEVDAGVVDPALLDAVSGLRKERKAYRKHLHSSRKARHMVEGAGDSPTRSRAPAVRRPFGSSARSELLRLREGTRS